MRIGVVTTWYPSRQSPGAGSFIARDVAALAGLHDVKVLHLVSPALDDGERHFWTGSDGASSTAARPATSATTVTSATSATSVASAASAASAASGTNVSVEVIRVRADVRTPAGWWLARRAVKDFLADADVLHTMAAPALLPWLITRPGMPWVHTEHWSGVANIAGSGRARLLRGVGRRLLGGPDVVVAVSGFLARAVRTMRTARIDVIGNIVDAGPADRSRMPDRAAPVTADAPTRDGLTLIGVGTIAAHKGWSIFVDALRLLHDSGLAARGVWVGDGPDREALAQAVHDSGLGASFRITGQIGPAQVRDELLAADIFVLPTRLETFSLATVEALGAGCRVVVTGVGGHVEMVTPAVGRVVERTADAVAAGVRTVADNCTRVDALARGRELAEQFSETEFVAQYSALYQEVTHA